MGEGKSIIAPFPVEIDRRDFGHYLSGLIDGEGHFGLYMHARNRETGIARFIIGLRHDDREILELAHSYWGCGTMTYIERSNEVVANARPRSTLSVAKLDDLAKIVVPHFDLYPLRAKKARDLAIWREGVMMLYGLMERRSLAYVRRNRPSWGAEDLRRFRSLHDALRAVRCYDASPAPSPSLDAQRMMWGDHEG